MIWNATHKHDIGHRFDDAEAVDPACDPDRQAFPCELVDQCQKSQLAAIVRLGLDEVVTPDVITAFRPEPDA